MHRSATLRAVRILTLSEFRPLKVAPRGFVRVAQRHPRRRQDVRPVHSCSHSSRMRVFGAEYAGETLMGCQPGCRRRSSVLAGCGLEDLLPQRVSRYGTSSSTPSEAASRERRPPPPLHLQHLAPYAIQAIHAPGTDPPNAATDNEMTESLTTR